MRMKKSLIMIVVAAAVAGPVLADDPAPTTTAPAAQGDAESDTSYLDKIVCKVLPPPTGTRLGSRKVCQTERQWRALTRGSQEDLSKRQKFDYGLPRG